MQDGGDRDDEEEVDALVGSRHAYPSESTITVRPGGCGVLMRWDVLEERSLAALACRRATTKP